MIIDKQYNEPNSSELRPRRIAVIGAGIAGISCAFFLARDGHKVTIIDPNEPGSGASYGNSGAINESSVMPSSTPGLIKKIPKMLMDPESPLVLRWPFLPRLLPWLIGFLGNSRPERVEQNCLAMAKLGARVMAAYDTLIQEGNIAELIHYNGALKVYETDAAFEAGAFERRMMDAGSCPYEILSGSDVCDLEPNIAPLFRHGVFLNTSRGIRNPGRMVKVLAEEVRRRGGTFLRETITDIEFSAEGQPILVTKDSRHKSEMVVLAAGARSGRLAVKLGARITLDAERGYHIMFPTPENSINRYVQFSERRFALVPLEEGVRMTSIVELASMDAKPDYRRIRRLIPHAARMLPGLKADEQSVWMGARPSTPDNVPIIGPSPRYGSAFFAFGHSHLGMTLGPLTGRIISDLVAGRDPGIDLTPYGPVRSRT